MALLFSARAQQGDRVRRIAVSLLLTFLIQLICSSAWAVEPKRIILLHSFGPTFKPWSEYTKSIRSELERQSPWPLDITDYSLVAARFGGDDTEGPFVEYLGALFAKHPLDLIVSVGAPAAAFVQRHRKDLFATTPMVFTAVEQRRVQYSSLTANDTVIAVKHDLPAVIENILRVLPGTKTVTVVNGTSPLEQFWLAEMRREFKQFEGRVDFAWTNELSFEDVLKRAAALPPQSAIFWELMIVDAAGVVHQGDKALARLYDVANAPIFSFDDSFFGDALVGGPMHSVLEGSRRTAEVVVRVLGGENAGDIKTPPIGFATPKYDWRQLQRWGISESLLPPGSNVQFRELSSWEKYRIQILTIAAAMLLQTGLIIWLVQERRHRFSAEIAAREAMFELTQMNRIAGAGELSASIAHEVNQPLAAIALCAGAALNWLKAKTPDIDKALVALSQIVSHSQRAGNIVSNLRAMFKKDTQDKGPVEINRVIQSVLELVKMDLQRHGVELRTQLEERLPTVTASEVQLQQVVLNLVTNARDALLSAPSPHELLVKSERSESGQVQVSIEDSGPGIPPSDLERIFQPMFTTKTHGIGMGLSICRSIVEAHGGRIWVAQDHETGAAFRFSLPANGLSVDPSG